MDVSRNVRLLTWFNFFTDFKLYAPIAILYFSDVSGSFALGMSVFSAVMISAALFEIPTGIFSDMLGRKKTLLLGSIAAMISVALYAMAGSFGVLIIGAICEGLSRSFYTGNNDALLYDTLSEKGKVDEYPMHYGRITSMFQLALAISGLVGSSLASWSFPLILWLSAGTQAVCVLIAMQVVEPQIHSKKSGNIYQHLNEAVLQFKLNKKLRLLTISGVIGYAFGEASYQFQAAFYTTLWPIWAVGIAKTVGNLQGALSFRYGHVLLKKIDPLKIIMIDTLYNRVVISIAVIFPTMLSPLLMSSSSLFFGITATAKNLLSQKEFTSEQRATMGSLGSFAGSLFFGIVAFLLGLAADLLSPAKAIFLLQVFQLANLFLYWKLFHHEKT